MQNSMNFAVAKLCFANIEIYNFDRFSQALNFVRMYYIKNIAIVILLYVLVK
jgi:hypothetical protein